MQLSDDIARKLTSRIRLTIERSVIRSTSRFSQRTLRLRVSKLLYGILQSCFHNVTRNNSTQ